MKRLKLFKTLVLASALVTAAATAQTPYDEGQKALRSGNWMQAARQFELAAQQTDVKAEQIAASMYWRAHALYKAGHRGDAARQISQLEREHSASHWLVEARALQIEYNGSIDDASEEDELRLFALSQLLERDLERALPLVLEIMNNTASDDVRQDAMFLLGMSDHPEARSAIADAARNSDDPQMQAHAVALLAMAGDESSLELLSGLYTPSASKDIKQAVLHAYFNAEQSAPLIEILRTEADPGMQRDIIHALGAMGATTELKDFYAGLTDLETKRAAIEAFAIAGDIDMLKQVLIDETDSDMRLNAVHGIAISGDAESADLIRGLYHEAASVEEKRTMMEALLIMDDAENLALQIVNTESDPELIELAIHALAMSGSTVALAGLYEQFTDVDVRKRIVLAMAMGNDSDGVRTVLEAEQNPEIKVAAIQALAMTGDDGAREYLIGLYDDDSRDVKTAVITSMMMLNDAGGLIALMNQETDPDLRREILQMLTMMDSEEADDFVFEMLESKG
jgi:HEAT repeat protein